ncbi:MAG: prepilin-type N-terminal cleavage/methylation domain-containing protein [Candidatus Eremiobacterota bacterium]
MKICSKRPYKKAFTLIELMIVFAIISIIAVILIPAFLKARENAKREREEKTVQVTTVNDKTKELSYRVKPEGKYPFFSSETIKIILSVKPHRIGMDVFNRFEADFKGQFLLKGSKNEPVRLDFRFPGGTTEARDVTLKFITETGAEEPENVIYDREGIFWTGILPENKETRAEISFVALGRNSFEYILPPSQRANMVEIELTMHESPVYIIPDWALQPTSIVGPLISWKFNNLVTDRNITVEFPEALSPLGKVVLMCKLVGIAVLFFGLGFWYLCALYRPEGLISFRFPHFLLLALTYSLFFVIFGVIGFRGNVSTVAAIGISAALSLPLLTLHVSRIIDMKFALTRNLVFSIFTLVLVINGVYGGDYRDYIFIGAVFIVIAFLTLTFRMWMSNKEKWINMVEEDIKKQMDDLEQSVKKAREMFRKSEEIWEKADPYGLVEIQEEIKNCRKNLTERFKEFEDTLSSFSRLHAGSKNENQFWRDILKEKIPFNKQKLIHDITELSSVFEKFEMEREIKEKTAPVKEETVPVKEEVVAIKEGKIYCPYCGLCSDSSRYCPYCGTRRPMVIVCEKCDTTVNIPLHIVNSELLKGVIYCTKCGAKKNLD